MVIRVAGLRRLLLLLLRLRLQLQRFSPMQRTFVFAHLSSNYQGRLDCSLSLSLPLSCSLLFVDCIQSCSLHWNFSRHRLQNNDYQKLLTFTCFWGFVCLFFWMPQLVRGLSDKEQKTWGNKSISLGSWICGW